MDTPIQPPDALAELKDALKKAKDAEQKNRIRAIMHIQKGATRTATALEFGISRTTLRLWIARYQSGGADTLLFSKGGRPKGNPKWDDTIFEALAKEIDNGGYWSIPRMQEWIKKRHHKEIPEQTVWYRMDKLHYSYKSARPHPMQGDREAQEAFKKGDSHHSFRR